MSQYVSQCKLSVNGQSITDFKSVTVNQVELRKQVNLMNKTGFMKMQPRYGVSADYVVPEGSDSFDFEIVENGTLFITYDDGRKYAFTGVHTLNVGEVKVDGENEAVQTIAFGCDGRTENP